MKRNTLIILILSVFNSMTFGQEKYFEKTYTLNAANNNGMKILLNEDNTFKIVNATIYGSDNVWHTQVCNMDLQGNITELKDYKYEDNSGLNIDLVATEACKGNSNNYAIVGRYETVPQQEEYFFYGSLLIVDEECDSLSFYTLTIDDHFSNAWSVAPTIDNGFIIGGLVKINEERYPYIVRLDEDENKLFEMSYPQYNVDSNQITAIVPTSDGNFILAIWINFSPYSIGEADAVLMKIDGEDGSVISENIIDYGENDTPYNMVATHDGGIAMAFHRRESAYPPISDYSGEGLILKFDSDLNMEWDIEVLNDSAVWGLVQLADSSFVACGTHIFPSGEADVGIAKVDVVNGEPSLLWRRYYGGSLSDYAYDMTISPDGGFAMVGRQDSLGVDTAYMYMIKTNCMGLLTTPEADYEVGLDSLVASFTNLSQYVYPDSIDGGHYLWDFGDGTSSTETHPVHEYASLDIYDVSLRAVVCNDTSVYTKTINTITNIASSLEKEEVLVYPNPADKEITIKAADNAVYGYELFNSNGVLIRAGEIGEEKNSIPSSFLSNGLYLLRLYSENRSMTQRVIVQH